MAVVLVDTNILVYAHDRGEPEKQEQAIRLLDALEASGSGRMLAQVLAEFFQATTKGDQPMLAVAQARQQLSNLATTWTIFDTTTMVVQEAARGVEVHRLSIYDAQIWASARLNQVPVVFSEDFADGSRLDGVRFVNPFAPEFRATDWLE
jgi:predicted nucleic acid-binding protein